MNKTAYTELRRLFLIEGLPKPLTPASAHLQIFDNYIPHTRMRIRKVRDPSLKEWSRTLQQIFPAAEGVYAELKTAEMHLDEGEYGVFEHFEGREVRKNRYFHEFDQVLLSFDVYLGPLWGLNTVRADFETAEAMEAWEPPGFAVIEVTNAPLFFGPNLVGKQFADIQAEALRLSAAAGR